MNNMIIFSQLQLNFYGQVCENHSEWKSYLIHAQALEIWDIMKEINEVTVDPSPSDKKVSRRESMEAKRAQQDKMGRW